MFRLESGLVVVDLSSTGEDHFGAWLLDANGREVELLANTVGNFEGSKAFAARSGQYLVNVSASGPWEINIRHPRPSSGQAPPLTLSGEGQVARGPLSLNSGLVRFELIHQGEGHFGVWLVDGTSGRPIELLANDVGNFKGSKAVRISRAGVFYLDIASEGSWSVAVAQ